MKKFLAMVLLPVMAFVIFPTQSLAHPGIMIVSPSSSSSVTDTTPAIVFDYYAQDYGIISYKLDGVAPANCSNVLPNVMGTTQDFTQLGSNSYSLPQVSYGAHTIYMCVKHVNPAYGYSPMSSRVFNIVPMVANKKMATN